MDVIYSKILSLNQLDLKLKDIRDKKISFCNGCFDIMHAGHVSMLSHAKPISDIFIVALNSDISIKMYKGDSRPIISLKDRMIMMASLQFVDYVTWFDEISPVGVIDIIKPDYIIKGENTITTIPHEEREIAKKYNSKILFVPMRGSLSTSNIINKIIDVYGN